MFAYLYQLAISRSDIAPLVYKLKHFSLPSSSTTVQKAAGSPQGYKSLFLWLATTRNMICGGKLFDVEVHVHAGDKCIPCRIAVRHAPPCRYGCVWYRTSCCGAVGKPEFSHGFSMSTNLLPIPFFFPILFARNHSSIYTFHSRNFWLREESL
jgi:hypothetical protein